jgi:hypothetical protein
MESKDYRQGYKGVLMLRGAQKVTKVRAEDLLDIYHVILFEHYLPWFNDFFGSSLDTYKKHLERLYATMDRQLANKPLVQVGGNVRDELGRWPAKRKRSFLGLPIRALGHFTLFVCMLVVISVIAWTFRFSGNSFLLLALFSVAGYAGLAALSDVNALRVFEKVGAVVTKLSSRI